MIFDQNIGKFWTKTIFLSFAFRTSAPLYYFFFPKNLVQENYYFESKIVLFSIQLDIIFG